MLTEHIGKVKRTRAPFAGDEPAHNNLTLDEARISAR